MAEEEQNITLEVEETDTSEVEAQAAAEAQAKADAEEAARKAAEEEAARKAAEEEEAARKAAEEEAAKKEMEEQLEELRRLEELNQKQWEYAARTNNSNMSHTEVGAKAFDMQSRKNKISGFMSNAMRQSTASVVSTPVVNRNSTSGNTRRAVFRQGNMFSKFR